jgi:hypothetical protein
MRTTHSMRHRFAWLEILLVLAIVLVILQVFPSLWFTLVRMLDVRNWSRSFLMILSVGILLVLFGVQFGPHLYQDWQQHRLRLEVERKKEEKQRVLKEQREMFERLQRGRRRRIY